MRNDCLLRVRLVCALLPIVVLGSAFVAEPTKEEVLSAMQKATDFMMKTVSNRGGFVFHYTLDLSKQWGEIPARKSQIWVQPPSTTTVGLMLLDAYKATSDPLYLTHADQVAEALIWGQHSAGGWHYFIDFDPSGIQKYYDEVASQCRGWEEFYHYYGNCTYDDDTTGSATRFLLRLYALTLDPQYRPSLLKALDFILESQYPNGGWPQRYPLRNDFPFEGRPDYTSFYTFNDDVISNNIFLLWEAYEKLGNEEYKKAARRGMDFFILSQLPSPQAGWAQQYDMEMKPGWARSYEPIALHSDRTVRQIKDLESFYVMTGDRRYLEPIPKALRWLEDSVINRDPAKGFTHATLYEIGMNKPLAVHHKHRKRPDGKLEILSYWVDYDFLKAASAASQIGQAGAAGYHHSAEWQDSGHHSGPQDLPRIDVEALKKEFAEVSALSPEKAGEEYRKGAHRPVRPSDRRMAAKADAAELNKIITSMDEKGAWIVDVEFLDTTDYKDNPPTKFKGIDTATYVSNMYKLMNSLKKQTTR